MELEASREHWSFTQLCKAFSTFIHVFRAKLFSTTVQICESVRQFDCLTVSQGMFDGDECLGTGSQSASVKLFFSSTRLKLIGFGVKHWKYGTHTYRLSLFFHPPNRIELPFPSKSSIYWRISRKFPIREWLVGEINGLVAPEA